jgi:hypothetical protein
MLQQAGGHDMRTKPGKCLWRAVLLAAGLLTLPALALSAGAPENYQVVDGLAIYLGVVPAQIIQEQPSGHPEAMMHGGVPAAGRDSDHVMVALFDAATGRRIEDALVKAAVGELGMGMKWKALEPMQIAGTITYGNYFLMPAQDIYRIQVRIRAPGRPQPVTATFAYHHFTQ